MLSLSRKAELQWHRGVEAQAAVAGESGKEEEARRLV
jgi:hypothetical protein